MVLFIKQMGRSIKKNTEARGSVPVSSSSSNGDSGCKETPSGDPGSDFGCLECGTHFWRHECVTHFGPHWEVCIFLPCHFYFCHRFCLFSHRAFSCDTNPAQTSESGLPSSKTPQTCDVRKKDVSSGKKCGVSVRKTNEPFDKENTEARGSESIPGSSSNGDSGCKELSEGNDLCSDTTMYGPPDKAPPEKLEIGPDLSDEVDDDSGVEGRSVASSCSIASMSPPPNMSPDPIQHVELFSSKTASSNVCTVGDTGGEEFKHPAPGRTTTRNGRRSRSLSFPYKINIDPFGEKPGSDQWVFPEQMSSGLHPKRWYTMSSLIPQGEPGLKSKESDKPRVTRWSCLSANKNMMPFK